MKWIITVIFLTISTSVFADDLCQFKGIPFGTSKQETLQKLGVGPSDEQRDPNKHIFIDYPLGDRTSQLTLLFDDKGLFYSFAFAFEKQSANKIDDLVTEDLLYITKIFRKKYGKEIKTFNVTKTDILFNEKSHFINKWENNKCTAFTGIANIDSQFSAFSAVFFSKLLKTQHNKNNEINTQNINQAAKDF